MIQQLNIIALSKGEARLIANACRFLAILPDLAIRLWASTAELADLPVTSLHYCNIDEGQVPAELTSHKASITLFASLASAGKYGVLSGNPFSTIYIHNRLTMAEPAVASKLDWNKLTQDMELYSLEDEDTIVPPMLQGKLKELQDISVYLAKDNPQSLLLTTNHQMVLAAINTEFHAWDILHPELNAINLGIGLALEANDHVLYKLQAIQKLIGKHSHLDLRTNGISILRSLGKDDRHAYSFFARKYDEYMMHVDYEHWIRKILQWFKEHSRRPLHRVFELACGTANVSSLLISMGYDVSASDLSPFMLDEAWHKPFKPQLFQGSLTDPLPGKDFDLILCLFDSINYLLNPVDITRMLEQVYQALALQGLFIFDISTRANSEDNFYDTCSLTRYQDGIMVHNAWYEESQMLQKSSLRFFRKATLGYSQLHEIHMQRVYLSRDLVRLINNSKLKIKGMYSLERVANLYPRSLDRIDEKFTRIFFVLGRDTDD